MLWYRGEMLRRSVGVQEAMPIPRDLLRALVGECGERAAEFVGTGAEQDGDAPAKVEPARKRDATYPNLVGPCMATARAIRDRRPREDVEAVAQQ
jgi:hypothetical protein